MINKLNTAKLLNERMLQLVICFAVVSFRTGRPGSASAVRGTCRPGLTSSD